jgi:ABC-type amino acid transport substrate-binding protein
MSLTAPVRFVLLALAALGCVSPAAAGEAMRYVHNAPESPLDRRYDFAWAVLRTALEKTRGTDGEFLLEPAVPMSEARQTQEMRNGSGALTVMILGTTPELERELLPIRIPVDRDLMGYSVLVTRRERLPEFAAVRTVEDLRRFTIGQGLGWIDVGILQSSGLQVVTSSSYDGLFAMAENGRFDLLLRSSVEVLEELATHREKHPELAIVPGVALHYPMPMYFWFSRSDAGRRLADRAERGLRAMLADGTYDRLFAGHQDEKIRRLDLTRRLVIRIPNPNLGPETPFADRSLWFDPTTYRVQAP